MMNFTLLVKFYIVLHQGDGAKGGNLDWNAFKNQRGMSDQDILKYATALDRSFASFTYMLWFLVFNCLLLLQYLIFQI
jgi:hypothetical protein